VLLDPEVVNIGSLVVVVEEQQLLMDLVEWVDWVEIPLVLVDHILEEVTEEPNLPLEAVVVMD
jgi:hypothetical protein